MSDESDEKRRSKWSSDTDTPDHSAGSHDATAGPDGAGRAASAVLGRLTSSPEGDITLRVACSLERQATALPSTLPAKYPARSGFPIANSFDPASLASNPFPGAYPNSFLSSPVATYSTMAERSTPPERPQPPAPARRSTVPLHYPAEQLQDEQSSYLRQESPDYDHGAIGRGRGRSRFSPANREDHAFAAPTSALSATQKKDIRAMNYSASSWPAALPDEATAHPYATAAQPDADYAHPQETNPAITLGSPFKTPPPNQTDFTHENGPARDVSLPPAAPERGVRPRHPPVSGSTTVVTGRGRSASAGSSNSAGGVNKDKILQELAAALEKERKKGKALGSEIVKGEEEVSPAGRARGVRWQEADGWRVVRGAD